MEKSSLKDELEQMIARGAGVVAGAGMGNAGGGPAAAGAGGEIGRSPVGACQLRPAERARASLKTAPYDQGPICPHLLMQDGRAPGKR